MTRSDLRLTAILLVAAMFTGSAAAAEAFAVFKSGDRGQSWIRADAGLPERSRINAFGSVNGVLLAGTDAGIFASGDEALSWRPAAGAAMSSGRILSFATLGRRVFAGTDGHGLLASPDGGRTWAVEGAFPSRKVRCLLAHAGRLHAGTDADGVFASSDVGRTWGRLPAGFPAHGQVFALAAVEGRLFAGLYSRGLYVWEEPARSWAKTGPVAPLALAGVHGTLVAGHNPGGLHWSGDLGATWSPGEAGANAPGPQAFFPADDSGGLSAEAPVWELAAGEGLVIAGASAGIYCSEDRGRTWTQARRGLPEESPGIAFLVNRDLILAGTRIKEGRDGPNGPETGRTPAPAAGPGASETGRVTGE